jgi:hypothetical protein
LANSAIRFPGILTRAHHRRARFETPLTGYLYPSRIRRTRAMPQTGIITRAGLKTPKAAAVAGILFSVLIVVIFGLLRHAIPENPLEPGAWLTTSSASVRFALNLVPFAGVLFLWFIGVLRDRLGIHEDRFFATVYLGSALLFLGMLFVSAAVIGAILLVFTANPNEMLNSATFHIARALAYNLMNIYAIKMAGVFMFSTSTVVIYTGMAPRWIAIIGFALALVLLLGSYYLPWSFAVLPLWVLLISVHVLIDNLRRPPAPVAEGDADGE